MKANTKKSKQQPSAKKKLIPAVSMFTVSALMLSTATYAWFTMSREVEVTGIQMTATVAEDLQISLGKLASATDPTTAETSEKGVSLATSTGTLFASKSGGADDLGASAPEHTWDWSNSADISAYYAFGRLMPASSTTGEKIFYTPDATGVGKTISDEASFYQANDSLFTRSTASVGTVTQDATSNTARATLHAYTSKTGSAVNESSDTWTKASSGSGYTQATNWEVTNDDGYYVDIPVWIRTSSNTDVSISVDGYVLPGTSWSTGSNTKTATELELYKAVRVALLNGETVDSTASGSAAVSTTNIIPLKDAWDTTVTTTNQNAYLASEITAVSNPFASTLKSIVDSANLATNGRTLPAGLTAISENASYIDSASVATNLSQLLAGVSSSNTSSTATTTGGTYYKGTYSNYTCLVPTNNSTSSTASTVATIPGSTTSGDYGTAKKLIIRVWLDGEDGECWNDNAGQDWSISLKFSKITSE